METPYKLPLRTASKPTANNIKQLLKCRLKTPTASRFCRLRFFHCSKRIRLIFTYTRKRLASEKNRSFYTITNNDIHRMSRFTKVHQSRKLPIENNIVFQQTRHPSYISSSRFHHISSMVHINYQAADYRLGSTKILFSSGLLL